VPLARAEYIAQQVEMSLRHLKLERLDLWQLHRIDPRTPVEESLGAAKKLQEQGKIRHIGLSEVSVAEIEKARKIVEIVSVQNEYNLTTRKSEDVLNYCEKNMLGFIPWFPMAGGKLTEAGGKLDQIAKRHGATVAQLSIAWLLHRSPVVLPIAGTSSVKHLEENLKSADLNLSDSDWREVESAVKS
jgi:aryl-alcohol dehydrogenase-like predicted oxidoreductase